jgi:hypothetical protein
MPKSHVTFCSILVQKGKGAPSRAFGHALGLSPLFFGVTIATPNAEHNIYCLPCALYASNKLPTCMSSASGSAVLYTYCMT